MFKKGEYVAIKGGVYSIDKNNRLIYGIAKQAIKIIKSKEVIISIDDANCIGQIRGIVTPAPTRAFCNYYILLLKSKEGIWVNESEMHELNEIELGMLLCMKLAGEV